MSDKRNLGPGQRGLGDMDVEEFRKAAHEVADLVADYLGRVESYKVLPDLTPGEIRDRLPAAPPDEPEPLDAALRDYLSLIEPNITHWQHPGFMAYFNSVASGPGILGEWLSSGLNSNVMLWRNAPASTELEEVVVGWMRGMLGLPDTFDGMFTDTASISSLLSVVAARHAVPGLDSRDEGLAGREGLRRLRMYVSTEAHFSIEKAAVVAGIGRAGVRAIEADDDYRMRPDLLEQAIAEDRASGWLPFCVVGTMGTTSSTSIDPAAPIAGICEREKLWFHIDAAYGGAAAIVPEYRRLFEGWERADSIVFNPHKWMFTPFDASLLLFRNPDAYRDAFSVVPEYVRTPVKGGAHNYNEYGVQMGRRFRALKLWMLIRYFGVDGIAARIRHHCGMARILASRIEAEPDWEMLAPTPFATVCFRYAPPTPAAKGAAERDAELNRINEELMAEVNRDGRVFLSHTKLRDRYTIRVTIGNPRTTPEHVERCWSLLREAATGVTA
jgi:aromatic-L-amino-acid decarboxylase